jgi:DNA-binding MarR family transcriptional regulator
VASIREILKAIQAISKRYISGRPPIAISGLTEELRVSKEEILPVLKAMERKNWISFYRSTHDAIKLTLKGAQIFH